MKKYMIAIIMIGSLGLCWYIGQKIHQNTQHYTSNETADKSVQDEINWMEAISFEGNKETSDNPWNITAGWIEVEGDGMCAFLNPNTSMVLQNQGSERLTFEYSIHPWMKGISDGAGIVIEIVDRDGAVLHQKEIDISGNSVWERAEVDLSKYGNAAYIRILCNNGNNDDDSGDWVIIKLWEMEKKVNASTEQSIDSQTEDMENEYFDIFSKVAIPQNGGILNTEILSGGGTSNITRGGKVGFC